MSERKKYIDIAKGILILFVVLAHSPIKNFEPINWFHMPAFLILSGYTFKMPINFLDWFKKSAKRLLVPYTSFYIINIILMLTFVVPFTITRLIKYIGGGVYSGRMIPGVFWFITTFFLMQIIFVLLNKLIKNKKVMIGIVFACYFLGHYVSSLYYTIGIYDPIKPLPITPWNFDQVPMMLFYFSIGFYGKDILTKVFDKLNATYIVILSALSIGFLAYNNISGFNYLLNMKYGRYNYLLLDIIVPCTLTLLVVGISKKVESFKLGNVLMLFGMYTFPTMYLHIPVTESMKSFINVGPVLFMVVSIFISYIFIKLIQKNKYMAFFFNGKGSLKDLRK